MQILFEQEGMGNIGRQCYWTRHAIFNS